MNRKHKFRAWDEDKKKMWSAEELGADQMTLSPDGKGFVNVSSTSPKLSDYYKHLIPLQYIERNDEDGQEIYDGDVVLVKEPEIMLMASDFVRTGKFNEYVGVVEYRNGHPCLVNGSHFGGGTIWDDTTVKVLGNIHMNPELMESNSD